MHPDNEIYALNSVYEALKGLNKEKQGDMRKFLCINYKSGKYIEVK